jgi:hypothetical protein
MPSSSIPVSSRGQEAHDTLPPRNPSFWGKVCKGSMCEATTAGTSPPGTARHATATPAHSDHSLKRAVPSAHARATGVRTAGRDQATIQPSGVRSQKQLRRDPASPPNDRTALCTCDSGQCPYNQCARVGNQRGVRRGPGRHSPSRARPMRSRVRGRVGQETACQLRGRASWQCATTISVLS